VLHDPGAKPGIDTVTNTETAELRGAPFGTRKVVLWVPGVSTALPPFSGFVFGAWRTDGLSVIGKGSPGICSEAFAVTVILAPAGMPGAPVTPYFTTTSTYSPRKKAVFSCFVTKSNVLQRTTMRGFALAVL